MRPPVAVIACSLALVPQLALASPYARVWAQSAQPSPTPAATPTAAQPTPTPTATQPAQPDPNDPRFRPTSSKAPPSQELETPPQPEPAPEVKTPEPEPEPAPPPPPEKPKWTRHGIGIRGGITVIPTWALRGWVQSMTNALCRGESVPSGRFGEGLTRVQGCNFYIGAEYIFRYSKNFDIVPAVAYHRLKAPDGYWLDKSETTVVNNRVVPDIGSADYTQVDFSFVALQVDFIGRGTVVETKDFAFQLGGGGGLGLGIIAGKGLWQTPLGKDASGNPLGTVDGSPQSTCNSVDDLGDFNKCTPHYQDSNANNDKPIPPPGSLELDKDGNNPDRFAKCNSNGCSTNDLNVLGREKGVNLPVIPIINLLVTARFLIKDTVGINLTGGWNTGFYFGGSLQYFFGSK